MKFTTQIEHVVVLMMENHSFDNMLGWLPGIGELTGSEANEYKRCWNCSGSPGRSKTRSS